MKFNIHKMVNREKAITAIKLILFSALLAGCSSVSQPASKNAINCDPRIVEQMLRWDKIKGVSVRGLANRRRKEAQLFLKDCKQSGIAQ